MKKTLVALAVLAASGASFAQVTITGKYGYGFSSSSTTAGGASSGLGISDSNITFGVSEDLGGGMTASAKMKIDKLNRKDIKGGDSMVSLSTSMGTVSMGLAETDFDTPDQFGTFLGATVLGGAHSDSERISDFIKYSNSFGPIGFMVQHSEAAADNAIGTGSVAATGQRINTIAGSYAAGPLTVKADYSVFDNKAGAAATYDTRTTLGGNYDLGVAALGLGYQRTAWTQGASATETFVGATIPLGALAVGVDFVNVKIDGLSAANDKTYSGWGVQAKYNLSKRTDVRFRHSSYDAALGTNDDKTVATSLVLEHSF